VDVDWLQTLHPSHVALTTSDVTDAYVETDQESYIRTDDDEEPGNTDWEDMRRRWVNRWSVISADHRFMEPVASIPGGDDARCVIEILGGVVKILLAITANNNSDNSNKIF